MTEVRSSTNRAADLRGLPGGRSASADCRFLLITAAREDAVHEGEAEGGDRASKQRHPAGTREKEEFNEEQSATPRSSQSRQVVIRIYREIVNYHSTYN